MEDIAAAPGHQTDFHSRYTVAAEVELRRLHGHFGYVFDTRLHHRSAVGESTAAEPVADGLCSIELRPADRAAGHVIPSAAGASGRGRCPAGDQERQSEHGAALERQVDHLLGIDGIRQYTRFGFHQGRIAHHRDRLLRGADLEHRFHAGGAAGLYLEILEYLGFKASLGDRQPIPAESNVREGESAVRLGGPFLDDVSSGIPPTCSVASGTAAPAGSVTVTLTSPTEPV